MYRLETDLNSNDINGNKECDKFKMNFRIIFHRAGYLVECAHIYVYLYTHICVAKREFKNNFSIWKQDYKKVNIVELEESVGEVYLRKRRKMSAFLVVLSYWQGIQGNLLG